MSRLAGRQRAVLAALKGRASALVASGPELWELLQSPQLPLLYEAVLWERACLLAHACPLTTAMLRRRGDFEAVIAAEIRALCGPAGRGAQIAHYLHAAIHNVDPLLAAVAATELALQTLRTDSSYRATIRWCHDPASVFAFLRYGMPFEDAQIEGRYLVRVGSGFPGGVEWRKFGLALANGLRA